MLWISWDHSSGVQSILSQAWRCYALTFASTIRCVIIKGWPTEPDKIENNIWYHQKWGPRHLYWIWWINMYGYVRVWKLGWTWKRNAVCWSSTYHLGLGPGDPRRLRSANLGIAYGRMGWGSLRSSTYLWLPGVWRVCRRCWILVDQSRLVWWIFSSPEWLGHRESSHKNRHFSTGKWWKMIRKSIGMGPWATLKIQTSQTGDFFRFVTYAQWERMDWMIWK